MAEIISYYSAAPSQGKRTLSLRFAEMLAQQGYKTLYIELDVNHPAIAIANQITNPLRNAVEYFQKTMTAKEFNVENFVINKEVLLLTEQRDLKKIFAELPQNLDFLVLPEDFQLNGFPVLVDSAEKDAEIKANEYIQKFMYALKTSRYEYVVLNLPNEINHIFGYEVIEASDRLINVITPSATRIYENKEIKNFLIENIPGIKERIFTVINQASALLDVQIFKDLVGEDQKVIVIPFDMERQPRELALENGSPLIDENTERLLLMLGIDYEPMQTKKFKLFGRG